jgi:Peptidase inhibitor I78 family
MIWALAILILASGGDDCGAAEKQNMVGLHAPRLTVVTINQTVRVVRPTSRHTKEYNPERLNIELDANEVVIAVYCG